jgi:trimeric autotransporter adhesin
VKFHLNRFLRRVRIHGGEFDTSARAMYREGVTSSLRADLRIVRGSTIERKQMSTKTTFKRIALVTVAALGFGTMAAVSPASATTTLTSVKVSDATVYGYVGETLTAKVSVTAVGATGAALGAVDSITLTAKITSISGANVAALLGTGATESVESVNADSSTVKTNLGLNEFKFTESSTAGLTTTPYSVGNPPTKLLPVLLTGIDTKTAFTAGSLLFRPSTPGTYKMTVTPSNRLAGGTPTYTAGVITFVVLSAGAATSDGALTASLGTANGVAGAGNYNQVKVTGQSGSTLLGTRVVVTGSVIEAAAANGTLSTDKTTLTIPGVAAGTAPNQGLINVLTPTVGTVTVNTYRETALGVYSTTADSTVTITVRAAALTGTATTSTTYMAEGEATVPDEDTDAACCCSNNCAFNLKHS